MLFVVSQEADKAVLRLVNHVFVDLHLILDHLYQVCCFILSSVRHDFLFFEFDRFLFKVLRVGRFILSQEEERLASTTSSGSAANTMDELVTPLRRVKLDDPVYIRDVDSSCREICCQKHAAAGTQFFFSERLINLSSLLLANFSM